jgi:hypothetical protein
MGIISNIQSILRVIRRCHEGGSHCAEIGIDPDEARGTITFYELPTVSLMGMPGAGVEPAWARSPRDFKDTGEGQRTKDLSNSLPFSRTSRGSTIRALWTSMSKPAVKPGDREIYGVQTSIRCRRLRRTMIQIFESAPFT